MRNDPLLKKIDAVTIPVPDLDAGLSFYRDRLGHQMRWRNDAIGAVGLGVSDGDSEIVLTTQQRYEPNWLVSSADEAAERGSRRHSLGLALGSSGTTPVTVPVSSVT